MEQKKDDEAPNLFRLLVQESQHQEKWKVMGIHSWVEYPGEIQFLTLFSIRREGGEEEKEEEGSAQMYPRCSKPRETDALKSWIFFWFFKTYLRILDDI